MTELVITPAEALEEIERRQISLSPNRDKGKWYATAFEPVVVVGNGPTPTEAIADLLSWIGKYELEKFKERPGYQNGMAQLEQMN